MHVHELSNDWELRCEELYYDSSWYQKVIEKNDGWLAVKTLPCDIHVPLIDGGIIDDPVVADNSRKCEWIEDRSWWFRKVFTAEKELLDYQVNELVADGLDAEADVFLNGSCLGHHRSETYPFRKEVKDVLREGENVLVIRVTSGLEHYNQNDLSIIKDFISCEYKRGRGPQGDDRRVFVRKPSYVYGWDWNPRLATCGIMGNVRIESFNEIAVRGVRFTTESIRDRQADICVEAEIENLYPANTVDAAAELDILFDGVSVKSMKKEVYMTSGLNYLTFQLTIDDPKLWWPSGMGEQDLYTVAVKASTAGSRTEFREFKAGIRTVELNTEKIDNGGRMFAFEINGIKTFCKGGNWETPDSLYGRVTDVKYERLVQEAKEANFNMFRFNGVNAYERDFFYDCCDRHGILIWQDFAFSCAAYPDELDWFRTEVEREVDYQTRRLRNHPCIALWCGNNECQGLMLACHEKNFSTGEKKPVSPGGAILYNSIMPRIIKENSSKIPYWNSSPFGDIDADGGECGDQHHWVPGFMDADIDKRVIPGQYEKRVCKFVSEFGCIGPPRKSSLFKYCGSENVDIGGSIWKMHTNTWEKDTVKVGIARHYADPESLSLEDYLLYAGLFQGVMLSYAFESMRCAKFNHGALMFSYNDCWGEIGWSIVDYYLVRKISYYFVKRALAHTKLAMRENGGEISIICMNDTREALEFEIEFGYVTFEGDKKNVAIKKVTVDPFTKAVVAARMKKQAYDDSRGVYYVKTDDKNGIIPAVLRTADFRQMNVPRPEVRVSGVEESRGKSVFTVSSDTFVHGVHFELGDDVLLSDEYFDLLPGEMRKVTAVTGERRVSIGEIEPRYIFNQPS